MNRIKREDLLRLSREQLADLLEELLTEMSPGGQRKWIQRNLPEIINSHLREKEDRRWISPDEVDGLIAIAEEENNLEEVLSLKEKFAQRSPPYLQDVIDYYKKKKDWPSVIKWTKVGIKSFGQHEDYVQIAFKMYYQLIEYHLKSGKSSRARPAVHYCVIIFQLSLLTNKPALWTALLSHLKIKHGRKRIIWQRLKDEGVVT